MKKMARIVLACGALVALTAGFLTGDDRPARKKERTSAAEAADPKRKADEEAIRKLSAELTRALEKGDAKALAALWTDEGEYVSDDGTTVRGRAAVGGSSVGVAQGPRGTAVTGSRGGAAIGPGGAVAGGSRVGAAAGPGGVVAGASRGGVAVNPYGLSRYSEVRGAGIAGHRTTFVAGSTLRTQGAYVRRSFVHYNCFTPAWYTTHIHCWRPVAWTTAAFWAGATWATVAAACSYPVEPVVYDYGSTIVYEDNRVYYNGEPVATAEEYATQATDLAVRGQEAKASEKDEWVSLGVFGMIQGDEKDANNIFQLAINKAGIIRGTYYNALSDAEFPVSGSVDRKTQHAAWIVGDRKDTVYETGIGNLTEAETTMLVHFGKDRTQQWTLVRLDPPEEKQ